MMAETQNIETRLIFPRKDARSVDEAAVGRLVLSISEVGLLNPLHVRPARRFVDGIESDAFELIAGAHRLAAMKRMGEATVECRVVTTDDLRAELAMIDENLMRSNFTPAQQAAAVARRKAIYEELHPETTAEAFKGNQYTGKVASDNLSFASETAKAVGKDRRTIERAARRGNAIGDDLEDIAGTSLDKGEELDALARMTEAERRPLIERAKAGERVSAKAMKVDDDIKQRAARSVAEWIVEHSSGSDLDALKANLFACGAKGVAIELTNLLGESIMDARYGSAA